MHSSTKLLALVILCLAGSYFGNVPSAFADPCGLVTPSVLVDGPAIRRIGVQQTYVFYHRGIESIVLRPGFSGSIDEFGMLIPFPSPPAIRKVPDDVFSQIRAAIDPPEVIVQVGRTGGFGMGGGMGGVGGGGGGGLQFQPPRLQVRVLKEEAVGMYEVAVLEAGSAEALKTWMEEHGYLYPMGMDVACNDYVRQGWCFVAVKTKVRQKAASEPRPGQRTVENGLPEGSKFDGHVQAMGFRFHARRPIVPMRLSVHNPGELRNIVYMLTDDPCRIGQLPESFVVRQISGSKLIEHFRRPLPIRLVGGDKIPESLANQVARQRNPRPHNAYAAELFAADILAARSRRLIHSHEQYEKQLLNINEALNLRGPVIEAHVNKALERHRNRLTEQGLYSLRNLTLTVLDAEFPREVLASQNLTFKSYLMPHERSQRKYYDAIEMGPPTEKPGRLLGTIRTDEPDEKLAGTISGTARVDVRPDSGVNWWSIVTLLSLLVGGIVVACYRGVAQTLARFSWFTGAVLLLAILGGPQAVGEQPITPSLTILVEQLGDPMRASKAAAGLMRMGEGALPALKAQAYHTSLMRRGWAIVCLGKLHSEASQEVLRDLLQNPRHPDLVRIWAGAALAQQGKLEGRSRQIMSQLGDFPEFIGP